MEVCDSPVSEAGVSDNHLYVGRDEDGVAAAGDAVASVAVAASAGAAGRLPAGPVVRDVLAVPAGQAAPAG